MNTKPLLQNKKPSEELDLRIKNTSSSNLTLLVKDDIYLKLNKEIKLKAEEETSLKIDTKKHKGWYQLTISNKENSDLKIIYAGRLDTGKDSISDPQMGKVV